ncbi:MAG TPA: hypothetical protein VF699_10160 [Caulobacteraceae bacterium]|jgi:hypothetical protein
MRLLACAALALIAAACAAPLPSPIEAVPVPEGVAATPDPNEDAIPASGVRYQPIASPPEPRLNSQIERMTPRELVAWVAPERTTPAWDAKQNRGRMGDYVGVVLFEEPRPTRRPGLCEVVRHGYVLRVFDEDRLPPQQQFDRPLQPYLSGTEREFRIGASTLRPRSEDAARAACWDSPPMDRYFSAPSTEAAWRVPNLMEQAQAATRTGGSPAFEFTCQDIKTTAQGGWEGERRVCTDPLGALAALTPHHLDWIKVIPCTEALAGPGTCYETQYRDPEAQEMGSVWTARLRGTDRPQVVELNRGILPPQ